MVHFDAKLTGTVEDVSLADLLQLFHLSRKSVTLRVSGYRAGTVVMIDGEIHHAQCADQDGEDALALLLAQKLVRVRTCAVERPACRTVGRAFGAVVLDILRQKDEHDRDTGDLPATPVALEQRRMRAVQAALSEWLSARSDVAHAALIDPRGHYVLACDSPDLWARLVQSLLMQTLVAPYFDDLFDEIDELLPALSPVTKNEDRQTVVTFSGRRYVLGLIPDYGWVAAMIFNAGQVSHGLSLTHMVALRQAIGAWLPEQESSLAVAAS